MQILSLLGDKQDLLKKREKNVANRNLKGHVPLDKRSVANRGLVPNEPTDVKIAELKLAAFTAQHCSLSTIDHVGELITSVFSDSKLAASISIHRKKCTRLIIEVISPGLTHELVEDILVAPVYSLTRLASLLTSPRSSACAWLYAFLASGNQKL